MIHLPISCIGLLAARLLIASATPKGLVPKFVHPQIPTLMVTEGSLAELTSRRRDVLDVSSARAPPAQTRTTSHQAAQRY